HPIDLLADGGDVVRLSAEDRLGHVDEPHQAVEKGFCNFVGEPDRGPPDGDRHNGQTASGKAVLPHEFQEDVDVHSPYPSGLTELTQKVGNCGRSWLNAGRM